MRAKADDLLLGMLWTCDMLSRPTLRNLTSSYEEWAYRNGFLRELQRLEKEQFLERHGLGRDRRLYRLTERGRLRALGGRDPEKCWKRKWDGYWRIVVFDISAKEERTRSALLYYLRNHGFGCLQRSVWITPDTIDDVKKDMAGESPRIKSLAFLKAQLCGGERNEQVVRAAWDFARIYELYDDYLAVLARKPQLNSADSISARSFRAWAAEERQAWDAAVCEDPLLPSALLPDDYNGRDAWERRKKAFQDAAPQMRAFQY